MEYSIKGKVEKIESMMILRIEEAVSKKLPSRSMVMVCGKIKETIFTAPLEPDGRGGHFMPIEKEHAGLLDIKEADEIEFDFDVVKDWPEPIIREDVQKRIEEEDLAESWQDLTTKARWEWIRWIRSTKNEKTRAKRIEVAISKLEKGDRRPCCFDSSQCTITEVAKSGKLLERY